MAGWGSLMVEYLERSSPMSRYVYGPHFKADPRSVLKCGEMAEWLKALDSKSFSWHLSCYSIMNHFLSKPLYFA
jgi:hypothetical protein